MHVTSSLFMCAIMQLSCFSLSEGCPPAGSEELVNNSRSLLLTPVNKYYAEICTLYMLINKF